MTRLAVLYGIGACQARYNNVYIIVVRRKEKENYVIVSYYVILANNVFLYIFNMTY